MKTLIKYPACEILDLTGTITILYIFRVFYYKTLVGSTIPQTITLISWIFCAVRSASSQTWRPSFTFPKIDLKEHLELSKMEMANCDPRELLNLSSPNPLRRTIQLRFRVYRYNIWLLHNRLPSFPMISITFSKNKALPILHRNHMWEPCIHITKLKLPYAEGGVLSSCMCQGLAIYATGPASFRTHPVLGLPVLMRDPPVSELSCTGET